MSKKKHSVCDDSSKNEEMEEVDFTPCEAEFNEVLCRLASDECGCFQSYIDIRCVFNSIKSWKPGKSVFCWGCFTSQGNQLAHACIPDPFVEVQIDWDVRITEVLLDRDNLEELQKIYNNTHKYNPVLLENFEGAIRLLLKEKMGELYEQLREKDMLAPGYSIWMENMTRAQNEYYATIN